MSLHGGEGGWGVKQKEPTYDLDENEDAHQGQVQAGLTPEKKALDQPSAGDPSLAPLLNSPRIFLSRA